MECMKMLYGRSRAIPTRETGRNSVGCAQIWKMLLAHVNRPPTFFTGRVNLSCVMKNGASGTNQNVVPSPARGRD